QRAIDTMVALVVLVGDKEAGEGPKTPMPSLPVTLPTSSTAPSTTTAPATRRDRFFEQDQSPPAPAPVLRQEAPPDVKSEQKERNLRTPPEIAPKRKPATSQP